MTACKFCEYKAICQFDTSSFGNEYNYLPTLKDDKVWEKIGL